MSKHYVGLIKKTSKAGNEYYSGVTPKNAGQSVRLKYWLFKDKKDDKFNVKTTIMGDQNSEFVEIGSISRKDFEHEGVSKTIYAADGLVMGTNRFYYKDDDDAEVGGLRYKPFNDNDGNPVPQDTHTLTVG
jgi:hypothetical protein